MKTPRRRETTAITTADLAIPAVEFVPGYPPVFAPDIDEGRCRRHSSAAASVFVPASECQTCRTWVRITGVAPMVALLLALASSLGACSPEAPPDGQEITNASPALDVIFAAYGVPLAQHPTVWGVPANCTDSHDGGVGVGFWLDGGCRGGLTDLSGTRIVLAPGGTRYSYTLAHEACHWLAGPAVNFDADHTGPCFALVGAAKAALEAAGPTVDVVQLVGDVGGFMRAGGQ